MRAALRPMAAAALFLLVGAISAEAASATWTGATSGSWQTPTNWTPNTTPGAGNTVTFAATATTYNLTTTGSVSISNIVINAGTSPTGGYYLDNGGGFNGLNVLTLTGSGISNASTTTTPNIVELGNTTLTSNQSWAGWVNAGIVVGGSSDVISLGASHTLTFNGIAGSVNIIDTKITGTGTSGVSLTGAGAVTLDNANSSFTGGVVVNGSASTVQLNVGAAGSLGTGTLTLTNGVVNTLFAGPYTNVISLNGPAPATVTFAAAGGPVTWSGAISTTGPVNKSLVFTDAATTFTGLFSGTQSMTVTGSAGGSMVLAGPSVANTYSGALTIGSGGVVTLAMGNGTPGTPVAALASSSITVNTGGTLGLGTNYTTTTTNNLTLAGGTFKTAGFSGSLGTLTLTATSTINLGNSISVIKFATGSPGWTAGTTLDVTGWNGYAAGGGPTQLIFGTTSGGLTAGQVNQILFINPAGYAAGNYYAQILSTGEVVPRIPEPSTIAMGVALAALAALWEIKRRRGVLAKNS